jgi:hypothetical protein
MLNYRPLSIAALAAAMAVSFGLAGAASAEDANAPPQKAAKVAAKSTKAHASKAKGKTPDEPKSDAAPKADKD